jgi:CheY-like chemotaxis protein
VEQLDWLLSANDDLARRKNILLEDDDSTFLKMVKDWLSTKYRVTIVTSGAQALMYIADNTPDLILLDYEMPVTSGPQVLEMIRSESKVDSIPVIFLTGKGDRESVMKVLALKPDGYLLKSMERLKLIAAIDDFFEKRKYQKLHDNNIQ